MPDQAHKLRELIRSASPRDHAEVALPPTVVVTGGKGGVGTTTVALNLAAALVHGGRRTVLVDGAPHADVAHLAGTDTIGASCISDVIVGVCDVTDALQEGPAGMLLLAGHWAPDVAPDRSARAFERLQRQLSQLELLADVLVIDSGCGMDDWTRGFWRESDLVLLVSTPDDTAILDAYATLKRGAFQDVAAENRAAEIRLLINHCDKANAAADAERRLAAACQRFLGRRIERAPRLPHEFNVPHVWSEPNSHFGRSVHQLGRCVGDLLSQSPAVTAFNRDIQPRELSKC